MTDPKRISVSDLRQSLSEREPMLIAAYDGPGFTANYIEGAVSLSEFKAKEAQIAPDQELVFY